MKSQKAYTKQKNVFVKFLQNAKENLNTMYNNDIKKFIVLILILIILVFGVLFLFDIIPAIALIIWFPIAIVNTCFVLVIFKNVLKPYADYISYGILHHKKNMDRKDDKEIKKPSKISFLSKTALLLVIILSCLNSYAGMVVAIPAKNEEPESEMINEVIYDFSNIQNEAYEFDIYFTYENDVTSLTSNLRRSFESIRIISSIPSDVELEGPNDYGNNALVAVEHENMLHDLLDKNNKYINAGPIPLTCCDTIIEHRIIMDKTYQTPKNRQQIIDAYLRKGYITGDVDCFEWAVKYAYARFYTELTWGIYSEKSLQKIIEMYDHLALHNSKDSELIFQIIIALEEIKKEYKVYPPVSDLN